MDNKLSELKAVVDYWRKVKSGELPAPGPNEISITVCTLDGAASRIAAMLADLEAKDKRIAELEQEPTIKHMRAVEGALISATDRASEWERKAISNFDECAKMSQRIEELEKRLATPVRLQSPWEDNVGNRWLLEGTTADAIRAAGFKCVGDE
ncbi:hypothetical protein I1A46_01700 [Serratia liquefaciens]|uniref:hypothetical protein n=1 Tax=Serratia liquefaciens TaxID=614 RepID=UPI00141CB37C|nr:hypothetical protein [Serratia liquefaciens]MBF8103839.1 hypothetical protein [Serratia liquefaciens]CAB1223537.1 hypothetical protein SFB10_3583 [Serratia liquefaciens]